MIQHRSTSASKPTGQAQDAAPGRVVPPALHMSPEDRLLICVYPAGFSYVDRGRKVDGDYQKLAFLPFSNLVPDIAKDCPKELLPLVMADIQDLQARRGESYQVSTCGQTITLGHALPK